MPNRTRQKWQRPFNWPPNTWEFTPGMQRASEVLLAFVFLLVVGTLISALIIWPMLIARTFQNVALGNADDVRNTLLAVAALIGVPFLIWRTLIAAKQVNIGRESHYTALFTKAVEQLGADKVVKRRDFKPEYQKGDDGNRLLNKDKKPVPLMGADSEPVGDFISYETTEKNYEVRLGAIYALERIAQDSNRDAWPIFQTLCAYVQNNAPPREEVMDRDARSNSSDIDEIFNVLSRYVGPRDADAPTFFESIHLEEVWLRGKNLKSIVFRACSIYRFLGAREIEDLLLQECDIRQLTFSNSVVRDSAVVDGKVRSIYLRDSKIDHFEISSVRLEELHIVASQIFECNFNLSYTKLVAVAGSFKDVNINNIEQGLFYTGRTHSIINNDFIDCEFVDCDFSLVDLSQNLFQGCKFVNCNLVDTGALTGEGNTFDHCMFADDVVLTPDIDALQQMRQQWTTWKFARRSVG